ncbi:MAG: TolC family protein [bacterium]
MLLKIYLTAEEQGEEKYTLKSVIEYALKNNPGIISAKKEVEIEYFNLKSSRAERLFKLDFNGGYTKFRYFTPVTPFVPGVSGDLPDVDTKIYDAGITFRLPLFKGGQLSGNVYITEMKKSIAEDNFTMTRQELIYNLKSVYYKISQFKKLLEANEASVKQLEEHKKNVELSVKTGSAAQVDFLRTEVELSKTRENRLVIKNSVESLYEFLKALMGMDNMDRKILIVYEIPEDEEYPPFEAGLNKAFFQRPDYNSVLKKKTICDERVKIARGRRYPDILIAGEYGDKSGDNLKFRENWNIGLRLSMPLFDWGIIKSDINKETGEWEKAKEEERLLRLNIIREVKNAYRNIETAGERIEVTLKMVESAKETLRIERLKYETGGGINTDVLDAQSALLSAETSYYQALYDKQIAIAYLWKVIGEE